MTKHIDTHQLLEYRSGLLDESPSELTRIKRHLASCDKCRTHWQTLDTQFTQAAHSAGELDEQSLSQQLAERRLAALKNESINNRKPPYASIAAGLIATVAVGVFALQQFQNTSSESITPSATQAAEKTEIEELVSSVDFFLWMDEVEQQESEG